MVVADRPGADACDRQERARSATGRHTRPCVAQLHGEGRKPSPNDQEAFISRRPGVRGRCSRHPERRHAASTEWSTRRRYACASYNPVTKGIRTDSRRRSADADARSRWSMPAEGVVLKRSRRSDAARAASRGRGNEYADGAWQRSGRIRNLPGCWDATARFD